MPLSHGRKIDPHKILVTIGASLLDDNPRATEVLDAGKLSLGIALTL